MSSRINKRTLILLLAATSVPAQARVDAAIRLDGVPDQLTLPAADGSNRQVTATVLGAKAESVWLAVTDDAGESQRVELTRIDESTYEINLAARNVYDALAPHADAGAFHIFARTTDGRVLRSLPVRFAIPRTLPERFVFPFDEAQLTIYQRNCKNVPGGNGELRICLNDITAGQVGVTVYGTIRKTLFGKKHERLVDTTSMRYGDVLRLPFVEADYALRLDRLVNVLIGSDFAEFTLLPYQRIETQRIDALLEMIEKSNATFIRNDQEYTGAQFATHLRAKQRHLGPRNPTLDEFIDQVATRSTETGKTYRIKPPEGDVMDVGTWLRAEAKSIAGEGSAHIDGSS